MSRNFIGYILLGIVAISQAFAACPCTGGARLNETQLTNLLTTGDPNGTGSAGATVCAIVGSDRWQEYHGGSRVLELGDNSSGEDVGGWSINGSGNNAAVTYSYGTSGSGGIYTYSVCQAGPLYDFCSVSASPGPGRDVTNASVKTGKGGC